MRPRTVITAALAAFVAASVLALVTGSPRTKPAPRATPAVDAAGRDSLVVAYYFHSTMRCPTCLAIEGGARDAIERAFPGEIAGGRLAWRSLDLEETGNEHFVTDFGITASSLILVREVHGQVTEWRNLPEVWSLVGDDAAFDAYVTGHTRGFLGAS